MFIIDRPALRKITTRTKKEIEIVVLERVAETTTLEAGKAVVRLLGGCLRDEHDNGELLDSHLTPQEDQWLVLYAFALERRREQEMWQLKQHFASMRGDA